VGEALWLDALVYIWFSVYAAHTVHKLLMMGEKRPKHVQHC